ncbi:MAG: LamG-like jellyroll fold domain-containing protein, partial [Thermoprotei archaeon]
VIYVYEPDAYADKILGYAEVQKVKNAISDPSLGVLTMHKNASISLSLNMIKKGNYLLILRYKAREPMDMNISLNVVHGNVHLIEIAKSDDTYGWFYDIYALRLDSDNATLVLNIHSNCDGVRIDLISVLPIESLKLIFPSLPEVHFYIQNVTIQYNNFTLIFHGVKWSPKGFYFDGIDDYIEVKGSLIYSTIDKNFTVLILLKPEGSPAQIFIAKDVPPSKREWALWWATVGNSVKAFANTEKGLIIIDSHVRPKIGSYDLYGLMYNGTHMALVLNGELRNTTFIGSLIEQPDVPLTIGCRGDRVAFFKGYVLAFMLYNRTLSRQELQRIVTNPFNPPKDGLILNINPFSLKFTNIGRNLTYRNYIEWQYKLRQNVIVAGKISCSTSPCVLVFAWPMRLPDEFIMKINNETLLPVKTLYVLHGYVIQHKGTYNFEILYNPSTLVIIARAVSLALWLVVTTYILVFITIRYLAILRSGREYYQEVSK